MTNSAGTKDASAMAKMHGLRTNVLGLPSLFAQSVALISPTMTAVLIIPLAFASAGQGTWLAYAFATVMLLFVVLCLNQFARRSAFAGLRPRPALRPVKFAFARRIGAVPRS